MRTACICVGLNFSISGFNPCLFFCFSFSTFWVSRVTSISRCNMFDMHGEISLYLSKYYHKFLLIINYFFGDDINSPKKHIWVFTIFARKSPETFKRIKEWSVLARVVVCTQLDDCMHAWMCMYIFYSVRVCVSVPIWLVLYCILIRWNKKLLIQDFLWEFHARTLPFSGGYKFWHKNPRHCTKAYSVSSDTLLY